MILTMVMSDFLPVLLIYIQQLGTANRYTEYMTYCSPHTHMLQESIL